MICLWLTEKDEGWLIDAKDQTHAREIIGLVSSLLPPAIMNDDMSGVDPKRRYCWKAERVSVSSEKPLNADALVFKVLAKTPVIAIRRMRQPRIDVIYMTRLQKERH